MPTAKKFGVELQRRRKLKRWSRAELAARSGVSESTISHYEVGSAGRFPTPGRTTIIDLVTAFQPDWDYDDALALVGEEPVTDDERSVLPADPSAPREPKELMDALWRGLSDAERDAVLRLVTLLAQSRQAGPARGSAAVDLVTLPGGQQRDVASNPASSAEEPDPDTRHVERSIPTPVEEPDGTKRQRR